MSLHNGLTDLRDNHSTCFTDMMRSFMVSGNLPSQLEILSTGQNYYEQQRNVYCAYDVSAESCNSQAGIHSQVTFHVAPAEFLRRCIFNTAHHSKHCLHALLSTGRE